MKLLLVFDLHKLTNESNTSKNPIFKKQTMPRRSKRIKTATQSGGAFGNLPRSIVVHMLKYFDIHEVARLQRLVCREFRDAGEERI